MVIIIESPTLHFHLNFFLNFIHFIYINNFFRQNNSLKVYQNTLIILKYYKFDNFYDLYKYEYYIFIFYNLIIRMEDLNPKYFH